MLKKCKFMIKFIDLKIKAITTDLIKVINIQI